MSQLLFYEDELSTISNALRVAAELFRANVSKLEQTPNQSRLADQFALQAVAAARVYERIAEETGIVS